MFRNITSQASAVAQHRALQAAQLTLRLSRAVVSYPPPTPFCITHLLHMESILIISGSCGGPFGHIWS